jgi:hypothetical protein
MNKEEERYYSLQVKLKVEALQECDRLKAELAAAKELLKQVFGKECVSCSCKVIDMEGDLYCVFSRELRSQEGRRADCPYLPFEETK